MNLDVDMNTTERLKRRGYVEVDESYLSYPGGTYGTLSDSAVSSGAMTFPPTLPKASFKVGVGDMGVTVVGDLVVLSKGLLERRRALAARFLSPRADALFPEWCVMARLTNPLMVQAVSRHIGTYVEVEACGWKGVAWLSHLERAHVRSFFDKHVRLNHDSVVVPGSEDLYRVFLDFPKLKRS